MDSETVSALLGGGFFVVVIGAAVRMIKSSFDDAARINKAWDEAARVLHGNSEHAEVRHGKRTLRASAAGKFIVIEAKSDDNNQSVKLRAGPLLHLAPLDLTVTRRGLLGQLAKAVHVPEVPVDDSRFRDAYRATGSPRSLAQLFLDSRIRSLVGELDEGFMIEDGEVVIERDGYPETSDDLVAMARFAGALVARWVELERAPVRFAADIGFVLANGSVDLAIGRDVVVATGMYRGREVTMTTTLEPEAITTKLSFDGGAVAFDGLAPDVATATKELDARIEDVPRQGSYR